MKRTIGMNLQIATAIIETIFAIPVLGAAIIVSCLWIPLLVALTMHIVTLVFTVKENTKKMGPIMGILASTVGLIPVVGWILHILAAIFNFVGAFSKN